MNKFCRFLKFLALGIALISIFAANAAADSILNIVGSTLGCFDEDCTSLTSNADSITWGSDVSFSAGNFDITTDVSGEASIISLGTIARGNVNIPSSETGVFQLQVDFTIPDGVFPGTYSATYQGTNFGGGGALSVDFDNTPLPFTISNSSGTGSFLLSINDFSVRKNHEVNITGFISNAQFTNTQFTTEDIVDPNPVPEPTSLLLFGTGLGVLGLAAYRRRRK